MSRGDDHLPVLGLICARGGSKGVPGKNIRDLCGKPLIAWSIEHGLACPDIKDVVVSTDDADIAEAAKKFGADVPFMRPPELARDDTRQIDAIIHALEFLKTQGREYGAVALLQPTCPLRLPEDITGCLDLMARENADTVITVTEEEGVVLSYFYNMDERNNVTPINPVSTQGTIRQDYPVLYKRCGLIYLMKTDHILQNRSLYGDKVSAYKIPRDRSFDIDSPFDWELTAWRKQCMLANGQ